MSKKSLLKIKQHEIKGVLGIDFMDQTYHWETDDLEWLFNTANTMLMWRQLKLSQEKVKVERANSEDVLEKMPIGLISFDIDGNATRINSKALELFGFKDFSVLSNFNIFTSPLLCSQTKDEIRRRPYYDSFFYYHQGYSPESQSNVPPESRTIRIDTRYSKIYDNDGNHRVTERDSLSARLSYTIREPYKFSMEVPEAETEPGNQTYLRF